MPASGPFCLKITLAYLWPLKDTLVSGGELKDSLKNLSLESTGGIHMACGAHCGPTSPQRFHIWRCWTMSPASCSCAMPGGCLQSMNKLVETSRLVKQFGMSTLGIWGHGLCTTTHQLSSTIQCTQIYPSRQPGGQEWNCSSMQGFHSQAASHY
jgi:hypothetical protein